MSGKKLIVCGECGEIGVKEKDRISGEWIIVCPDCNLFLAVSPRKSRQKKKRKKASFEELHMWRSLAHEALDPLWKTSSKKYRKGKGAERDKVYKWLSASLGVERHLCHISKFNVDMCQRVVSICSKKKIGR